MKKDFNDNYKTILNAETILEALIVPAAICDSSPEIIAENLLLERLPKKDSIVKNTKRELKKHIASLLLGEAVIFPVQTGRFFFRVHVKPFNTHFSKNKYFLIQWENLTTESLLEDKFNTIYKLLAVLNSLPITEEEKHFNSKWLKALTKVLKIQDIGIYVEAEDSYANIIESKKLPYKLSKRIWLINYCLESEKVKELQKKDMEKLTGGKSKNSGIIIPVKAANIPPTIAVIESKDSVFKTPGKLEILKPFLTNIVKQKLSYTKTKKVSDLFEDYHFPSVLVEKESLKVVYENKRFVEYFGKNKEFFNQILTPKSSYELLKKLEETKDVFKIYLETLDKNGFIAITKATVIPRITSKEKNFFSVILKTQLNAVELSDNIKTGAIIDFEDVSSLMHKYSLCFLKQRNTEKTVNDLLEEIRKIVNADSVFIAKTLGQEKRTVIVNCNPHSKFIRKEISGLTPILKKAKQNNYMTIDKSKTDENSLNVLNSLNAKSMLIAPIFIRKEDTVLAITCKTGRKWSDNEIQILMHTANLLAMVYQKEEILKTLNEEQKRNRELEQIKKLLLTEISHEIKTPLTSIIGLSNLLEAKLGDSSKEIASHIKNNSIKLLELLETILDIERIKEKGILPKVYPFNTAEFIEKIKSFVNGVLTKETVSFFIKTENLPPYLVQDENIVYRMIINLLDNAISNTKRGSITLGMKVEGKVLSIEVTDTGTGMDNKDLEYFFQPYVSENYDGKNLKFGLGLYLVKEMCSALNGKITVKSVPDMGTYFKIEIPVRED